MQNSKHLQRNRAKIPNNVNWHHDLLTLVVMQADALNHTHDEASILLTRYESRFERWEESTTLHQLQRPLLALKMVNLF